MRPLLALLSAVVFSFVLPVPALAQDMQSLMTEHLITCPDVAFNSMKLIPKFYGAGRSDSAMIVLNYWDSTCGNTALVRRTRLLFNIMAGRLDDSLLNLDQIRQMELALPQDKEDQERRERFLNFFYAPRIVSALNTYETFTHSLAHDALPETKPGTFPYLLARHYSGRTDSTFADLQDSEFDGTPLRLAYDERIREISREKYLYVGFGVGRWFPASTENKVFGDHTQIDLRLGLAEGAWDAWMSLAFLLGGSETPYEFSYVGSRHITSEFGAFGLEFGAGYAFTQTPVSKFQGIIGLALNSYSPPEGSGNPEKKGIPALLGMFGLGWRQTLVPYGSMPELSLRACYYPYLVKTAKWTTGLDGPQGSYFSLTAAVTVSFGDDRREMMRRLSYRRIQ